ncbi:MAG: Ig-like domain-containing protein, partial [Halobacteriota archaeon]
MLSITTATANAASLPSPTANASPTVGATTHPIQYAIAGPPSMVDDGSSLASFKGYGFSIVELVVPDNGTYQAELNTIKALGMQPVIDVEMVIWNGGKLQNTPITSFRAYFQSLENAGWEYVASEGLNSTDLAYMQNFFKAYVNYNCDDCGLWQNLYINPFTVLNSWESYYPSEWPYIQNGSKDAAALGIQNGVMAGLWANVNSDNQIYANSLPGSSSTPSYLSMLNWSYANGIGFNQFCVWCGNDANALNDYTNLEFPQIVANLQTYYPAIALNATVSTATAYVNQNFTINGTLRTDTTGIADGNITLQRFTNNATWTNVTPPMANTTNGTGGYAFSRNESAAGTYYYRTAYDENATYTTATSNVVNVTVTKMPTALTLTASNTTPAVSQPVTFNATLSNGTTPLPGENVTVYHLLNNVRYNDTTNTTNSTGQITVTTSFGSPGTRTYYATFAGDSSYQNSTSSVVTINVTTVTKMPTALTLTASNTTPLVNQPVTFNATLSSSGASLSGENV